MNRKLVAASAAAMLLLTACTGNPEREAAQKASNDQQKKYEKAVPFPAGDLSYPLDRKNVAEYLKRSNDPNRVSYVYLLSKDAKVIAYYTIKGKVTSVSSQLLPQDDLADSTCGSCTEKYVVDSAGDDGTYGGNEGGVFFFTTDGTLVTWTGDYLQSDRPQDVRTPVSLVAKVG
ncbi:hypothetical protein ABZ917_17885 [Nonomuraea wenchangensis]